MSLIFFISLLTLLFNMNETKCFSLNSNLNQNLVNNLAPAVMLTTTDTITFIYPSEMGYEKDYLHIVFKLINLNNDGIKKVAKSQDNYKIEEAVFDNKTWSIYFIISNSSGGSDLVRLKRHFNNQNGTEINSELLGYNEYLFEIDSNWSFQLMHKFNKSKLLSIDINLAKRRLYLFEFNKSNKKYSIVLFKLTNLNHKKLAFGPNKLTYFTFDYMNNYFFKNDGYLYITIARDNFNMNQHSLSTKQADIILFISNNQTLNICYLINMTCNDFFRQPIIKSTTTSTSTTSNKLFSLNNLDDFDYVDESAATDTDDYYLNDLKLTTSFLQNLTNSTKSASKQTSLTTTLSNIEFTEPLYTFGRLMAIRYDHLEHAIYLNDYGYDCIYKLTFEKRFENQDANNNYLTFKLNNIEAILKTDLINNQSPLNPIMSFIHDSHIYWIDYEDGLKTIVYKSSCIRTIYKVKEPISLKLIYLTTFASSKKTNGDVSQSSNTLLNKLVSLKDKFKYKYPPEYYINGNNKQNGENSLDNMPNGKYMEDQLNSSFNKLLMNNEANCKFRSNDFLVLKFNFYFILSNLIFKKIFNV